MIYDKEIRIYAVGAGDSPLLRKLSLTATLLCRINTVYRRTSFEARQQGETIDRMVRIPEAVGIEAGMYAGMEDGHFYRIVEARPDRDGDERPVIDLSLHREEARYDVIGD